jgi:hypothetical protein
LALGFILSAAVETLVSQQIGSLLSVGRFAPGASAGAIAGAILQQTSTYLLAPALGALLIVGYAVAAAVAGLLATARRDVG